MVTLNPIQKVLGNFGIAFFTPLASGGLADNLYDIGLSVEQLIIIALVNALIYSGLSISKEVVEDAERKENL